MIGYTAQELQKLSPRSISFPRRNAKRRAAVSPSFVATHLGRFAIGLQASRDPASEATEVSGAATQPRRS